MANMTKQPKLTLVVNKETNVKDKKTSPKQSSDYKNVYQDIQNKDLCATKISFFRRCILCLYGVLLKPFFIESDSQPCPRCQKINTPVSHIYKKIRPGINHVGVTSPNFGIKVNKYICVSCKKEYFKHYKKESAICPHCDSLESKLEKFEGDDWAVKDTEVYGDVQYTDHYWGSRTIYMHEKYVCNNCKKELYQFTKTNFTRCCPHCKTVGDPEQVTYVDNVSTYTKHKKEYNYDLKRDELVQVAYEHGYRWVEYVCRGCNTVVGKTKGEWYDEEL